MKAKVNTKSNYKNLNGKWLDVIEIVGTRVSCSVDSNEFGKQTVDFHLRELTDLSEIDASKIDVNCLFLKGIDHVK